MRSLALLLMLALAAGAAYAQDNTTGEANDSATGGNDTATDAGNETAGGEPAAPACPTTTYRLVGREDSKWYLDGAGAPNPTLTLCPGTTVTFVLVTEGSIAHNFKIEGNGVDTPLSRSFEEGDEPVTYEWTTPESGTFTYICKIHGSAMSGRLVVRAPQQPGGEEPADQEEIGGETVNLKDVSPNAPCDRPIPAIVTRDVVGGPTVADYEASCATTQTSTEPPPHVADYVLPLSFVAIALGVVGMVWVHKYYKP